MVTARRTDVEVVGPGPLGRLGEEVVVGRLGRRREEVAEPPQRTGVAITRLDRLHRELEVEDGLGGEARYGRRADVLEAQRDRAEGLTQPAKLLLGQNGPRGVEVDDPDGRVEALVERRMAPQNRPSWLSSGASAAGPPGSPTALASSGSGTTGSASSGSGCGGASSPSSSGRRRKSARSVSSIAGV